MPEQEPKIEGSVCLECGSPLEAGHMRGCLMGKRLSENEAFDEAEMKSYRRFETVRHGEKQGEQLSEAGVAQSKTKAHELSNEIRNSPDGAVLYIMTSNVERAVATRDVIENELRRLLQQDQNIEFISVQDIERIQQTKGDFSRKYVVTDIQPSTALGFNERTSSIPAFLRYKKLYKNNEDLIGETWAARSEELAILKDKIRQAYPDIDVEQVDPKEFHETPEEAALKYIRLMKRMTELTEKYFHSHPWKGLQIGHNLSADFAALALLGKDISVNNIEQLGGKFRDFMESAQFEVREGKTIAKYREQESIQEKSVEKIIKELEHKSETRRAEWEA